MKNEKLEGPVKELQCFAKLSNSHYREMNKRITSDLAFAGGDMYTEQDRKNRGKNRPEPVLMLLNDYCDQVINAYSQSPFGIDISAKSLKARASVDKIKGVLRGIQQSSDAKAVFTVAIDRQTKAGRGYALVTTDYASSEGFEQVIKIEPIHNPEMVIWDRFSKKVNGKDCQETAVVEHISCERAESEYGEEHDWDDMANPLQDTIWSAPEESVAVVTYYKLKKVKTKIYQGPDGSILTETEAGKNSKLPSRQAIKTTCMVYKIIGDIVVSTVELPIQYVPVVPFLGQMIDRKKKLDFVGLVYFGRTPSQMINWAAGEAMGRLAKAPKSLLMVEGKSIINYKRQMDLYGTQDFAYGQWDSHDPDDPAITYAKPEMLSASVDVSDMSATQANYQQLLSSVLGMSQSGSQAAGASNQTAAEVLTRAKSMDISKYRTLDNASESIKQICRVILELMPTIYDTARLLPVVDSKTGLTTNEEINVADLGIVSDEYEVDITSGPMSQTLQSEKVGKIIAIMSVLPPEQAAKYEKYLVEASEALKSTDVETLFGSTDMAVDPEATAALDQADQHITSLTEQNQQQTIYIQQLQAEIQSQKAVAQSSIAVAQINAKNKIDVELIKQQGSMTETQLKIQADADKAAAEAQVELIKQQQEIANQPINIIAGEQPMMTPVGGMRNDLFNQ